LPDFRHNCLFFKHLESEMSQQSSSMWGGRFSEATDAFVAAFTASVTFDKRLYRHDIMGSIAHATMLAKVGVLTEAERDLIVDGLQPDPWRDRGRQL
jgi:hypothetical protein